MFTLPRKNVIGYAVNCLHWCDYFRPEQPLVQLCKNENKEYRIISCAVDFVSATPKSLRTLVAHAPQSPTGALVLLVLDVPPKRLCDSRGDVWEGGTNHTSSQQSGCLNGYLCRGSSIFVIPIEFLKFSWFCNFSNGLDLARLWY